MNIDNIKKLSYKEQKSLALFNLFMLSLFFIVIFGFYYLCSLSQNDFEQRVSDFESGKEITCRNTFISKKRGWIIDANKKRFIKGDKFMEIKSCKKGY